ncbi:MAG: type III secretion protein HrpB4 [Pseudomonadota bacterium]
MMQTDRRSRPLSPATFAEFYLRLHQKSINSAKLFDSSWTCHTPHRGDTLRWSKNALPLATIGKASVPLFANFLDRLILLTPSECQKLLGTAVLLSRREAFRHCIDGGKIRALQAALGTASVAAVLKSTSIQKAPTTGSDWQMTSLLAEAFSHVEQVCQGPRKMVLETIKVALPRQLPVLQSSYDETSFDNLLREVCAWYPELTWLFG